MNSVDTNPEFATFSSLTYNSDDESHRLYEVQMLKKPNDSSYAKLVELSSSEFSGSLQSNSFYFKNNKVVATIQLAEEYRKKGLCFVERVTYYDSLGNPFMTKERLAEFEEDLGDSTFYVARINNLPYDKAINALDQTGEFAPRFKQFLDVSGELYLVVGGSEQGGYISVLMVQSRNGFVYEMYQNPEKYINKVLSLSFTKEISPEGEYQLLHGASLVE